MFNRVVVGTQAQILDPGFFKPHNQSKHNTSFDKFITIQLCRRLAGFFVPSFHEEVNLLDHR